jgi:flagellar biosynthesis protein FliQ
MIWAYVMYLKQHGVERGLYFTWGIPICAIVIGLIVGFINKDQEFIYNLNDHASTSSLILSDTALIAVGIIALLAIAAILWSLVKRK